MLYTLHKVWVGKYLQLPPTLTQVKVVASTIKEFLVSILPLSLLSHIYKEVKGKVSKKLPVLKSMLYCSSIALIIILNLIAGFKSSGNTPRCVLLVADMLKFPASVKLLVLS